MFKRNLSKAILSLLTRIGKGSKTAAKRLIRTLTRSLMVMTRRNKLPMAGFMLAFVLPTVTMVMLVVVLLTLAITLRSFDRAQNARNVRVNQAVLSAATPALDRAKAKINFLLKEDPQRPLATPSDNEMYRMMAATDTLKQNPPKDNYSFGDETRLKIRYDLNNNGTIEEFGQAPDTETQNITLEDDEATNTAWRYGVDTDNNGKVDTYTIYGIFFRSPPRNITTGKFDRARRPLEARTPPMPGKISDPACAAALNTSASLVGDSGWYKSEGRLKKSFFVYTVNVPITNPTGNEEAFKGTTSVSALEYQQDQSRIPLSNNAVVYEDDLEISAGPDLTLNGRIFTNSNLLVTSGATLKLSQVSSPKSCFYDQENSKIIVGGNVMTGDSSATKPKAVTVDLFKKGATPVLFPTIDGTNKSVSNTSLQVLYNTKAYADRLALLVKARMEGYPTGATDPTSVINRKSTLTRKQALEGYFKEILRKVPFAEVPMLNASAIGSYTTTNVLTGSGDTLRPADRDWNFTGVSATLGTTSAAGLTILPAQLNATYPDPENPLTDENLIGDRIQVGNNLPAKRWDGGKFVGLEPPQEVDGSTPWTTDTTKKRTRSPRVTQLADVGAKDRGGFWEVAAAQLPKTAVDGIGGLRVITAGGVYERVNSFLPPPKWVDWKTNATRTAPLSSSDPYIATNTYDDPATPTITEQYPVVWPDTMPMSPLGVGSQVYDNSVNNNPDPTITSDDWSKQTATLPTAQNPSWGTTIDPNTKKYAKGDLRMRATAVYHYANNAYDPSAATPDQTPIACISSYYDPSTSVTAKNLSGLPYNAGTEANIGSNNGVVYGPPTTGRPTAASTPQYPPTPTVPIDLTTGFGLLGGANPTELERQANYVFPNGRFANEPLRKALLQDPAKRTLADNAAIDATNCSLEILKGTLTPSATLIPHGAIKEISFLNAREIKAIDRNDPITTVDETFTLSSPLTGTIGAAKLTGNYDLALEERQPLEIRATVLNINDLRAKTIAQANTTGPTPEYLLPNSGIIYATRDDALPDRSDRQETSTTPKVFDEETSKTVSPTDSLLDPTRRPNGIMLINGEMLFRGGGTTPATVSTVEQVVKEKGLTLVSNLPVYIKGEFNKHTKEEFEQPLTTTNFYTRSTLDKNFACRPNDPRLSDCTTGDKWRPATVLADAITLLSPGFREGFRNEGDFDLNNNVGAAAVGPRRDQGFYNNSFAINGLSSGAFDVNGVFDGTGTKLTDGSYLGIGGNGLNSSYFNNFVTPVQRRGNYPEYLMEVCTKLPVSECKDTDWFVDPTAAAGTGLTATEAAITGKPPTTTPPIPAIPANSTYDPTTRLSTYKAGTTVDPPIPALQRFPRRVAFRRIPPTVPPTVPPVATDNNLFSATDTRVIVLGINGTTILPVDSTSATTGLTPKANSLWFASAISANPYPNPAFGNTQPLYFLNALTLSAADGFRFIDGLKQPTKIITATTATPSTPANPKLQPLLMPILQIHLPKGTTATTIAVPAKPQSPNTADDTKWLSPVPASTVPMEFNLIVGAGDVPSRVVGTVGEFGGGLQNLPRFIENWRVTGKVATKITGSFVQLNRSAYSTAPLSQRLGSSLPQSAFSPTISGSEINPSWYPNNYNIGNNDGSSPFFIPPGRAWGFDVGLLSQSPDLFTQRFTTPSTQTQPAEYFREVNRDDEWVKTLLCAVVDATGEKAVNSNLRPTSFCTSKTGGEP